MSDSSNNKNAFNEKTVVQSRPSFDLDPAREAEAAKGSTAQSGERTVVFAQSNLKETFDARTVVRPAKTKAPPPVLNDVVAPPSLSESTQSAMNAETGGARKLTEPVSKDVSRNDRHAQRAALDRRTRTMIAAFATLCVLVILCLVVAFGGPKTEKTTAASHAATSDSAIETTDLASETPANISKKTPGAFQTTTEVLSSFDRAAQRAQEHALDYSKSNSGF